MCSDSFRCSIIRNIKFRNVLPTDWRLPAGSRPGFVVTCNYLGGKLWHPFTGGGVQASVNLSRLPVVGEASEFTHALRESWRYWQWESFTKAQRRDSMYLCWYPYDSDPQGCQAARKGAMHQGGHIHVVACMTGAFVSPLRFARIHHTSIFRWKVFQVRQSVRKQASHDLAMSCIAWSPINAGRFAGTGIRMAS